MNVHQPFPATFAGGLILLISFFALSACAAIDGTAHSEEGSVKQSCEAHLRHDHVNPDVLAAETAEFQVFAERALVYRTKTIEFYRELETKLEAGEPLSGHELDILNQGMADHLAVRKALLDVAHSHECWLDLDADELTGHGMGPDQHLRGVMISLAAALVLYDNYLLAVSTFEENPKLRRLLNSRDSGYQIAANELSKVTLSYVSIENRRRTREAIRLYERRLKVLGDAVTKDADLAYLNLLISQSPSYNMTKRWSPLFVIGRSVTLFGEVTVDALDRLGKAGVNLFSMAFGNTVGLVETRKGKLYGQPSVEKTIRGSMQPGDILLEKTPFRLTDQFIPGHWGHAAIWVGTEDQLRELEIWDHPLLIPHHDEIRRGHGVVEALRGGVTMSTLAHFMNVDDVAVLRSREATRSDQARIVLQAMRQIGKDYDFNFDVETTDKIVCSELIYLSYTGYEWPTVKTLGRATISPDNVASKAFGPAELELILFYHDGRPVLERPLFQMKALVEGTQLAGSF